VLGIPRFPVHSLISWSNITAPDTAISTLSLLFVAGASTRVTVTTLRMLADWDQCTHGGTYNCACVAIPTVMRYVCGGKSKFVTYHNFLHSVVRMRRESKLLRWERQKRYYRKAVTVVINRAITMEHNDVGARGSTVGWGAMLQAWWPRGSILEEVNGFFFFSSIYLILPTALRPWGSLSLWRKWVPMIFLASKEWPTRKVDSLTAICECYSAVFYMPLFKFLHSCWMHWYRLQIKWDYKKCVSRLSTKFGNLDVSQP
jgi:hypothetical protein